MERVLRLWGKTTDDERFHPAIYHMLNVGHVAQALLGVGATSRFRDAICGAWQGANTDALLAWLPYIVALHDIGKIAAVFQGQRTTPQAQRQRERLEREEFVFGSREPDHPPPHNAISALFIHDHLRELMPGTQQTLVKALRDAAGGHHGFFVDDLEQVREALVDEPAEWHTLRCQGFELLRTQLAPAELLLTEIGAPRRLRTATITLTGLIVLSDWIGSNVAFFAPDCETPLDEYIDKSRDSARDAVIEVGFGAVRRPPTYSDFATLFPKLDADRPLPQVVDALNEADLAGPALYVIEAPAGEGKTEVALALARRLAASGHSDELFFALPTMATGNQMFQRLSEVYHRLYGKLGTVKLAHGQAMLVEDELRRVALLSHTYDDSDTGERHWAPSDVEVLDWFSSSKRALLAPFGAGTVDQVELAGLHTRYYMLKLFSLARKVVVIDEAHAYDTYMNTILDHTLQWLAALGSSVILLSATLPAQRRAELARTFLQGVVGAAAPAPAIPADQRYPTLSIYSAQQQRSIPVNAFRAAQRLTLRLIHDDGKDYDAQAQRLLDLVADGGAVARLCNRVDDAQQIFAALQRLNPPDGLIIHARFPLEDRQRLERRVDDLVGRNTKRAADDRVIIVGTQVLEQSLDYDVDVMVTDLAPIDLLLQRAGRLHRHTRKRPPRHQAAVMYVQVPLTAENVPDWRRWKRIYDEYVLWQTWDVLKKRAASGIIPIMLPNYYRPLIKEVYTTELPTLDVGAPYAAQMQAAWDTMQKAQAIMDAEAKLRLTPKPLSRDGITRGDHLEFIEDEEGAISGWQAAKTRLGDRVTVIPLYDIGGAWSIDAHGERLLGKALPGVPTQVALLNRALPISDPRLIKDLRTNALWPWRKPPALLRHVYPLILDRSGATTIAGIPLRLDPMLGLTINLETV